MGYKYDCKKNSYSENNLLLYKMNCIFDPRKKSIKIKKFFTKPWLMYIYRNVESLIKEELDESFNPYFHINELPEKEANEWRKKFIWDMLSHGVTPLDFVEFHFEKRTEEEKINYVTSGRNTRYFKLLDGLYDDNNKMDLFDDKIKAIDVFRKFYKREMSFLCSEEDIPGCVDMLQRLGTLVIKPQYGSGGHGFRIIKQEEIENPTEFFSQRLKEDKWLIEEKVVQAGILSDIHPSSVNTIRAVTFAKKSGESRLSYTVLRMGRGGSVVDNNSSGGICCEIDKDTGVAVGKVYLDVDHFAECEHPDTHYKIIGSRLPEWDALKEQLKEQASVACEHGYRIVGWDMAYSDKGWCMIEGNDEIGSLLQLVRDCGLSDYFEKYLEWAQED